MNHSCYGGSDNRNWVNQTVDVSKRLQQSCSLADVCRRLGGAMTADNMSVGDNVSIPDTLASPRSNMSIPVETLVDLLDGWGAR